MEIPIFELVMLVLLGQALVIWYLLFRLRKQSTPTIINQVKNKDDDMTDYTNREQQTLPTSVEVMNEYYPPSKRALRQRPTKSHFNWYVVWKTSPHNSAPLGLYRCEWDEILDLLPGRVYPGPVQVKGAQTLDEAVKIWRDRRCHCWNDP